jgi:hypothetical protein
MSFPGAWTCTVCGTQEIIPRDGEEQCPGCHTPRSEAEARSEAENVATAPDDSSGAAGLGGAEEGSADAGPPTGDSPASSSPQRKSSGRSKSDG